MFSSFQEVLNNTCCVISALYMISMSGARTSPLPYLYLCMRTKLCSFFFLWWAVEIGRASYTTDIYSLWSNWKFYFLCLNSVLKYLYIMTQHDCVTTWPVFIWELLVKVQLFPYYRGEQSLLSYSRLSDSLLVLKSFMGTILTYQNTKWKTILNGTVYDSPHSWACEPLVNNWLTLKEKNQTKFKSRYGFIFSAC